MALNDTERARAEDIHRAHAAGVQQIRNDGNLSAEGRRAQLDDVYDQAEGKLDTLYARANQRDQADGQAAYRAAFGLPGGDSSTVLAARDARDRLSNASPQEAGRLLGQALNSGDETLARAAGEKAYQSIDPNALDSRQWSGVLEQFAGSTPARQRAVGQLAGQLAGRMDSRQATQEALLRHVSKPVEIQHGNARQRAAAARAAAAS